VPLLAGGADGAGLEGGVAQDHHGGALGDDQRLDQLGRQFGLLAVGALLADAVAFGVITAATRDAQARGGQQQAQDEAMARTLGVLLVLALALLGATTGVGAAEGVLGLLALLADVSLIEDEDPGAVAAGLLLQQQLGALAQEQPVVCPAAACQEADDGGAMSGLGADGSRGGRGRGSATEEGREQAQEQGGGRGRQLGGPEESLDLGQGVGEDHDRLLPGRECGCG
jgi:hypothetical protein